jgi:predicted ATP-grasp superfamily ATP-dependent carboligase
MTLHEFGQDPQVDLSGATLVVGFPGLTLTSVVATGYLREQLKLPLLAVLQSASFPPRCLIEDGRPVLPIRIFGTSKIVVVLCEFKLPTNELISLMTKALFYFAVKHKLHIITVIEGIPLDEVEDAKAQQLAFVATCKKFSDTMIGLKHEALGESVIVGAPGAILAESTLDDRVHVACVIAPTSSAYPDVRSAIACVKALTAYCGLDIDLAPMEAKSQALLQSVKTMLKSEQRPATQMYT